MRKSMVRRGCCWLLTMAFVLTTLLVAPFGVLAEDDEPVLELLATIPINDVAGSGYADDADGAYIYSSTSSTFDSITGYRWCDNAEELIYQFKLSDYNDLVVETELGGNYVLEAAGSPDGPWTMVADWKTVGGGDRAPNSTDNKAIYYTHFSRLGITGEMGYLRLSNMDRNGGWGGTIWGMKLYKVKEATAIEKVIAAIDAIGSDAISLANYSVKVQAVRAAQNAYNAWKASDPQADDAQITNLSKLTAASSELDTFLDQYDFFARKTYSPEALLAMAETTSVKPEGFDALVGVTHAASGKLYDGIVSDAATMNYSYEVVANIPVNDAAKSDVPYIYRSNAQKWLANERFCDNDQELIYKFNLTDYDLAVKTDLGANYVLEAAGSPDGPWTMIADYGVIGGGIRAGNAENRAFYTVHFSALGITGETGYIRLSNVDRTGGWGGAIFGMELLKATATPEPLVRPGDRLRLEVDFSIPSPSGDNLLTAAARNGKFGLSLSLNQSDYEALTEKKDSAYGYTYRTAVATVTLPTVAEDAEIEQALKDSGFALSVESAAAGCTVYRISLVDATNDRTLISLSKQALLDVAQASSNPSGCMLSPMNYETFDHVVALRSPDGVGWYSVNYLETPYQDWQGRPLCHAGDEIEYVFHVFYEGTDTVDLPDEQLTLRLIAATGTGAEIGRGNNDDAIVFSQDYNELELIEDGRYGDHPYKEYSGFFVIPDDAQSEAVVQSNGFRILIGTHLDKESNPLVIYGVTMTNLTTGAEIISATAADFRFTNYEDTREEITDGSLGGLRAPWRADYAPSTLLCSDEEELEPGTYSYNFRYATMTNKAKEKAVFSVVDEDGNLLASQTVTATTSGRYDTQPVLFTLTEKTKVHCKVEVCNGSDFYLKEISLNDLVTEKERKVREVISTIDQLPAADAITLADKRQVSNARIDYNRLSEEQRAQVTNYDRLTAAEAAIIRIYQEAADAVIASINALPAVITLDDETAIVDARNAYNNLDAESKELVTNLSVLDEAEIALVACKNQAAADVVIAMIDALPEKITQQNKEEVNNARKAYNRLSEVQKNLVTNLDKLVAAEKALEITYGDLNDDGNIDASDALIALQHSVSLTKLEGNRFTAADVDQSGTVDASDALCILQYSVKLIDTLPVTK